MCIWKCNTVVTNNLLYILLIIFMKYLLSKSELIETGRCALQCSSATKKTRSELRLTGFVLFFFSSLFANPFPNSPPFLGVTETLEAKHEVPQQLQGRQKPSCLNFIGSKCHSCTQTARLENPKAHLGLSHPITFPDEMWKLKWKTSTKSGHGEERGMPADKRAAVTEMDLELQLVALSFSGAPAN